MLRSWMLLVAGLLAFCFTEMAVAQHAPMYYFASSNYWQNPSTDRYPSAVAALTAGNNTAPWEGVRACSGPYNWSVYNIFLGQAQVEPGGGGYPTGDFWTPYSEELACATGAVVNGPAYNLDDSMEQWATCSDVPGDDTRYEGSPCPLATVDPAKNQAQPKTCPACVKGDPVNVATGNAYKIQTEYRGPGSFPLELTWAYNSLPALGMISPTERVLGANRTLSYLRSVRVSVMPAGSAGLISAYITRGDGRTYVADFTGGAWTLDADINGVLSSTQDSNGNFTGFTYLNELGETESYNSAGDLVSITDRHGFQQTLMRDPTTTLITSVQDSFGRTLQFLYDTSWRLSQVIQPDGGVIKFAYDANNNLQKVTYPDTSFVTYNYNESAYTSGANLPNSLTSTVDEASVVYDTTTYNAQGLAIATSLANNVLSYMFTYQTANDPVTSTLYSTSASIAMPLGATEATSFQAVVGINKPSQKTQSCSGCVSQSHAYTFGTNGLVKTDTDPRGYVTAYAYSGSLETQEVEAQGQPSQRTTNTQWNMAFREPLARNVQNASGTNVSMAGWSYNFLGEMNARCEMDPSIPAAAAYVCTNAGTAPAGVRRWVYHYCGGVDQTQCPVTGLLISVTSPRTDVTSTTTYAYYMTDGANEKHGDLKSITDALGHTTTYLAYDGAGRVLTQQDANGVYTDFTYTPRGWLRTQTIRVTPDNSPASSDAVTTIKYTPYGTVQVVTDPDGVVQTYGYDPAHRLTDITDALGKHIHYTLDADGNKTKEQTFNAAGTVVRSLGRNFNALDQLVSLTDGLSQTVFSAGYTDSYDSNGNLVHSADGNAYQREQAYDPLNRLIRTVDNYNGIDPATQNTTTAFQYDALDRTTNISDPTNLATVYGYDGLSNRNALQSPDTGASSDGFDAAGNRVTHTDAKNIVSTSTYDLLDRLTSVSYSDSAQTNDNVTYHYDEANSVTGCANSKPLGRLTRVVEYAVTTVYCYGGHGNMAQKQQITAAHTDTTTYGYTSADRLQSVLSPNGTLISYGYNTDNGEIGTVQVTLPGASTPINVVSASTWNAFGPISSYTLGNGQVITRTYDANYRLTDLTSPALNLHFARDVMGSIKAEGAASGANPAAENYNYDPLYRLTTVSDGATTVEGLTYNSTGDRVSKSGDGLDVGAYTYTTGTHQLHTIGAATTRLSDANGSTISNVTAGQAWGYGYNGRGRLTVAQASGVTVATYLYNAMGQRVQKVVTSPVALTQRYAYDEQSHLLGEYTSNGNRDTIWMGDLPVATVDTVGPTSTLNYIVADQLSTPRSVTNASGAIIWSFPYVGNPFGETTPTSSNGYVLNLRYPGQYYDVETGLSDWGFRSYESATGRSLQSDPIGFEGGQWSTYAYVDNNPLNYVDPSGLQILVPVPRSTPVPLPIPDMPQPTHNYPKDDPVALCLAMGPVCVVPAAAAAAMAGPPSNVLPFPRTKPTGGTCPKDDGGDNDRCYAQYETETEVCNAISRRRGVEKGEACHASATQRLAACMKGQPLPPLNTWNN